MKSRVTLNRSFRSCSICGRLFHDAENVAGGLGAKNHLDILETNKGFEREENEV